MTEKNPHWGTTLDDFLREAAIRETATVTAEEFQRDAERYLDAALKAPLAITKDGRPQTVLLSATLFEILVKGRIARPVEDLDEATLQAIADQEPRSE